MAVQLQINQQQLVKNLKHAFTGRATFLAELMQNARRAGATYVAFSYDEDANTLTVEDDGCGIEDPQVLFSIAESGWSDDVKANEHPFGLGFLSALYQADEVEIRSRGKRIIFSTEEALGFAEIPVDIHEEERKTSIRLVGVPALPYRYRVEQYARGFPIPVYWGDEALPRPDAIDTETREFFVTRVGLMSLVGWPKDGELTGEHGTWNTRMYLQGICVREGSSHGANNIVHLDPQQFMGRMPDRDRLVDQEEVDRQVDELIARLWRHRLRGLLDTTAPEVVAKTWYPTARYWQCLDLFDEIPYLPVGVCEYRSEYPVIVEEWEVEYRPITDLITRKDVERGTIKIVQEQEPPAEYSGWQVAVYLYETKAALLTGQLSPNHWIHDHLIALEPSDVRLSVGTRREAYWDGYWAQAQVWFVDQVRLDGPLGEVTSSGALVACGTDLECGADKQPQETQLILVPEIEQSGYVVRQLTAFLDEFDNIDERGREEEQLRFVHFLMSERAQDATGLLQSLISRSAAPGYEVLQNKTFIVRFDQHGTAAVELLEEA